jgi:hypothetical protein
VDVNIDEPGEKGDASEVQKLLATGFPRPFSE